MLPDKYNPYRRLTDHHGWHVVDSAINDLIENKDIVEKTAHEFIVGLIVAKLWQDNLIDQRIKPKDSIQVDGHWNVSNQEGVKIKEVTPDGTIIWEWNESKDVPMKEPSNYDLTVYDHPKKHPAWQVIDSAIEELIENDDLAEKTEREYIVGYVLEQLIHYKCFG